MAPMKETEMISKIKELKITTKCTDGSWEDSTTYYLLNDRQISTNKLVLREEDIAKALGIDILRAPQRRLLFLYNPEIFHAIESMHPELRELAMDSASWVDQVEDLKKELYRMAQGLSDFESKCVKKPVKYLIQKIG